MDNKRIPKEVFSVTKAVKTVFVVIALLLSTVSFSSCGKKDVTPPTCAELISAYENAGYHTFHRENTDGNDLMDCYVKVWLDDENEYAFFHFFENAEKAKEYESVREYNILIWLFSVIYGSPTWVHTKVFGNIEYEYENRDLIKPFKKLMDERDCC